MKKITTLLIGVILLTSCTSTGAGALSGAMFGSIIGSAIGGLTGGFHGRDIGTLVGMAAGAATGAAAGAAAEKREYEEYKRDRMERLQRDSYNERRSESTESGYSSQPIYNDVINMEDSTSTPASQVVEIPKTLNIKNVRFINDRKDTSIKGGELVKVSFEIHNDTENPLTDVIPMVQETTGNKRLLISPSTMIERMPAHRGLRYTAYISAQEDLKDGMAHFVVSAKAGNSITTDEIGFDVALESK